MEKHVFGDTVFWVVGIETEGRQLLGWITKFKGLGVPGEDSLGSRTN